MRTDFYRTFNLQKTGFKNQILKNIKQIIIISILFLITSCGVKEIEFDKKTALNDEEPLFF